MKRKGKNVQTKSGCWCENKFAVWIVCTAEDDCVLQCCFLFDCLAEHFWQTLLAVLGIFSATRIYIRFWSEFSLCCPPRCGQPPQPALPTVWLYPSRYTEGQQTFKCSLFVVICSLLPVMCSLQVIKCSLQAVKCNYMHSYAVQMQSYAVKCSLNAVIWSYYIVI